MSSSSNSNSYLMEKKPIDGAAADVSSLSNAIVQQGQGSPSSELPELEDLTAAEAFIQGLAGMNNQSDIESMIRCQKQMLARFEKTNEMMRNCNALSSSRYKDAQDDFRRHIKLLIDMKKDLDYVYRKLRIIKKKVLNIYPDAAAEAQPQRSSLAEEAEDESASASVATGPSTSNDAVTISEEKHTNPINDGLGVVDLPETSNNLSPSKVQSINPPTTVEYVQMEEAVDNGKPIENELIKKVCSLETANPNDSSDCTSEDTG